MSCQRDLQGRKRYESRHANIASGRTLEVEAGRFVTTQRDRSMVFPLVELFTLNIRREDTVLE
jgi:hypothetical protein